MKWSKLPRMTPSERPSLAGRYPEIDLLRGVAGILMVIFHIAFDLTYFAQQDLTLDEGLLWVIGRSAAVLFVALAGVSLVLAWRRKYDKKKSPLLLRGIQILGMGLVLTAFTWMFFPTYTIWFGVLHLIGLAVIIGTLILPHFRTALILGSGITILGIIFSLPQYINSIPNAIPLLPNNFQTFDYFPLLPWMGLFFLGMCIGEYLYPSGRQRHIIPINIKGNIARAMIWTGRNSLLIYFIHQPILVGIIMALKGF